ncbi:hypothetical protein LTR94_028654, partial [Friedmanniomyces endolithicus]
MGGPSRPDLAAVSNEVALDRLTARCTPKPEARYRKLHLTMEPKMDLKLDRKRALVCGGSSGLGRAVATALVAEGAHVALLSRNLETLKEVADQLNAAGPGRAVIVAADLADHDSLLKAADQAEALLGGHIEILLNNTGGPPPSGVSNLDPAVWRNHVESMVLSVFRLTDRILPKMRAAGWGRILNVAS